jgi:hypothetical protein
VTGSSSTSPSRLASPSSTRIVQKTALSL